ncbi:zinc finger protein HD1-like [Hibiscus syriacus]|uniref:zinc finger protein HD1-like n=1 Tax=Hibiscus syriacus TaxID=106335 RepID=UPI00192126A7|nr:zinc finger protein HD1-like [Hibiscus syriacus]
MLKDVIHPQEQQLPLDNVSSPISGPVFYFFDADPFSDAGVQSSEVTYGNCSFDESNNYGEKLTLPPSETPTAAANNPVVTTTTSTTVTAATSDNDKNMTNDDDDYNNNLSIIFDSPDDIDNDISASIDFFHLQSPSNFSVPPSFFTQQEHQFDLSLVQNQLQMPVDDGLSQYGGGDHRHIVTTASLIGPSPPSLTSVFDDDCFSSMPSFYLPLNPSSPSCSFLGGHSMAAFMPMTAALPANNNEIFAASNILTAPRELFPQDLDFQGDNSGIFCPDSMQRMFKPGDLEISSLEDSSFNRVGKLSVEQRKEKIHRYLKKRNERNFTKKIKYACRKTLADSRPRVRGRFAKNDDFGETQRQASSNLEEDDDDDQVIMKEDEDMVNSWDIFAHINGVNSFKPSYSIQSWI